MFKRGTTALFGLQRVVVAPSPDLDLGDAGNLLDIVEDRPRLFSGKVWLFFPGGLMHRPDFERQAAGRLALIDQRTALLFG